MIKDLSISLIRASQKLCETQDVLPSCIHCGQVIGSCVHANGVYEESQVVDEDEFCEDAITKELTPSDDEPEEKLSGRKEEILINPQFSTFTPRRP